MPPSSSHHTDMPLDTPEAWIDELAETLTAELREPKGRLVLPLTCRWGLPNKLAEIGTTPAEVLADLNGGFVSRSQKGGAYFLLSASRFDVFVHTEKAKERPNVPLAVVTSVKIKRSVPYRGRVRAEVTFNQPYDECECDIAAVHEQVQERLRYERAVARARERSVRVLGGEVRQQPSAHSELHAQVRRHFSALQQMIELLHQRSETEGTRKASGTVLPPSEQGNALSDTLCVRADERDGEFRTGVTVQVSVPGRRKPWNLELVAVEDDLFHLEPPAKGDIAPGTPVQVTYRPKFGLARHAYALRQFLQEEVEGDWNALARLVSKPATLPTPGAGFPRLATFFDDRLNEEQRQAVAGALGSRNAFLIQGPPGTGKTTVITEIVRQLVSRGERVLLLAPMHVAVDEVLRRVGDAPGVLALRASYDDSRVQPDLRRFTKDNLTADFVRRIRRPGASREPRWRAEAERLAGERALIDALTTAREEERSARRAGEEASAARERFLTEHRQATEQAAEQRTAAERAARAAAMRRDEAGRVLDSAARSLAEAESGTGRWERFKAAFGAGALVQARRVLQDAEHEAAMAGQAHDQTVAWYDEQVGRVRWIADRGRELLAGHDHARAQTAARLEAAARSLEAATRALDAAGLDGSEAALAARARRNAEREGRLARFAYLERRWFELTGMAEADSDAEERRISDDLGGRLIGAANLICCTTTGFGGDPDIRDADYDTLIVDEASRVIDSEFLIGARQARRWILVGDEQQLPPYVEPADEYHLHALAALHMAERERRTSLEAAVDRLAVLWREDEELHQFRGRQVREVAERIRDSGQWNAVYRGPYRAAYDRFRQDTDEPERLLLQKMRDHLVRSLFERCVRDVPDVLRQPLVEQRRMIDPIASLVREPVYGGRYHSPSPERLRELGVTELVTGRTFPRPMVFLDTSGHPKAGQRQAGTGVINPLEATLTARACRAWDRELADRGEREVTVSVLTFYKAQAREIRQRLGAPRFPGFRVLRFNVIDSIDRIQGQQSDLVLISFCRTVRGWRRELSNYGLWLQDIRRLNVACTRARRAIVLVGHRDTLARLRGVEAAERFYANLMEVFTPSNPDAIVIRQLDEAASR